MEADSRLSDRIWLVVSRIELMRDGHDEHVVGRGFVDDYARMAHEMHTGRKQPGVDGLGCPGEPR